MAIARSTGPAVRRLKLICPEIRSEKWFAPQTFRGVLLVRRKIRTVSLRDRIWVSGKALHRNVVYINFARGCGGATQTPDP